MSLFYNPWVITIIGGLAVAIIGFILKKFFSKEIKSLVKSTNKIYGWKNSNIQGGKNNTVINSDTKGDHYVNININDRDKGKNIEEGNNLGLEELKKIVNIIFVDDDLDFKIVKILKKMGWRNTKIISDIADLDKYKNTHIFFIDINGVGKKLQLEHGGMDLAFCLKNKFENKKVVIYSSDTSRDMSHPIFREVNGILPKNAQVYEFTNYIEKFAKEIKL